MNPMLINFNYQVDTKKESMLFEKKAVKSNEINKFDNILSKKMKDTKDDGINRSNINEAKEKAELQKKPTQKELKDSTEVKKIEDSQEVGNIQNDEEKKETEDIPQEIANLLFRLNDLVKQLENASQNGDIQTDMKGMIEELKSTLNEVLTLIEKSIPEVQNNPSLNEMKTVLQELINNLEMVNQNEIKIESEDFAKVLSQLKELVAANVEDDPTIKNQVTNKSELAVSGSEDDPNQNENMIKNQTSVEGKKEKESNEEQQNQMSQDTNKERTGGFFANKAQQVVILDEDIQSLPSQSQFVVQNNANMMEAVKVAEANIQKPDFNNIMGQIMEKGQVMINEKGSEMTLQLKPDHLGNLTMKIEVERGIVIANIVAESQVVKEVIESNFNQLRDALNEKGFGIEQLNVSVGQDSDFQKQQSFMKFKKKNSGKMSINAVNQDDSVFSKEVNDVRNSSSTIDQLG